MSKTIPPRTSSRYYGQYSTAGDVHRLIQILMESCKISVESKKPDTAQDRYDLAIEAYYQILTLRPAVALEQLVTEAMGVLVDRFPSQRCMNEAVGLCDKAKGKSVKTQLKYLLQAQGVLENGLAQPDIGYRDDIKDVYDQVIAHVKKAEALIDSQGR